MSRFGAHKPMGIHVQSLGSYSENKHIRSSNGIWSCSEDCMALFHLSLVSNYFPHCYHELYKGTLCPKNMCLEKGVPLWMPFFTNGLLVLDICNSFWLEISNLLAIYQISVLVSGAWKMSAPKGSVWWFETVWISEWCHSILVLVGIFSLAWMTRTEPGSVSQPSSKVLFILKIR